MAQDDQLKASLERTLTSLRSQLDGNFRAAAEEIVRALTADRARAVAQATADVRRQAQEQLGQLRDAARKQNDELRTSAETQVTELRRMLDDLRRDAQQQIDNAHKTLGTEVAAARAKAAAEVEEARRVARQQVEDAERTLNERIARLERDLDVSRTEASAARQQAQEARQQADGAQRQAEQARLQADEARHAASAHAAHADSLRDVVDATRALDSAGTLADVFARLIDFAGESADRSVLLLVDGGRLEAWHPLPSAPDDLDIGDRGLPAAAVRERRPVTAPDGQAIALPIMVAGVVVAVLYAGASSARVSSGTAWTSSLEVVARHASRVLETTTVQQAAGLLASGPMARPSQTSPGHRHPGSLQ